MPFDADLAERIRGHLHDLDVREVREVAMFAGRSFMVHGQLAVAAASDGLCYFAARPMNSIGCSDATAHGRPRCAANP